MKIILETEPLILRKEGGTLPIKYYKLFALMKEKGITTYRIRKNKIISESAL